MGLAEVKFSPRNRERLGLFIAVFHAVFSLVHVSMAIVGIYLIVTLQRYVVIIGGLYGNSLPIMILATAGVMLLSHGIGAFLCISSLDFKTAVTYRKALIVYIIGALAVTASLLASSIMAYVPRGILQDAFETGINTVLAGYILGGEIKTEVDKFQMNYQCCGANDYNDWFQTPWIPLDKMEPSQRANARQSSEGYLLDSVPFSCCNPTSSRPCTTNGLDQPHAAAGGAGVADIHKGGCTSAMSRYIRDGLYGPLGHVLLTMFFMEILLWLLTRYYQTSLDTAIERGSALVDAPGYLLPGGGNTPNRVASTDPESPPDGLDIDREDAKLLPSGSKQHEPATPHLPHGASQDESFGSFGTVWSDSPEDGNDPGFPNDTQAHVAGASMHPAVYENLPDRRPAESVYHQYGDNQHGLAHNNAQEPMTSVFEESGSNWPSDVQPSGAEQYDHGYNDHVGASYAADQAERFVGTPNQEINTYNMGHEERMNGNTNYPDHVHLSGRYQHTADNGNGGQHRKGKQEKLKDIDDGIKLAKAVLGRTPVGRQLTHIAKQITKIPDVMTEVSNMAHSHQLQQMHGYNTSHAHHGVPGYRGQEMVDTSRFRGHVDQQGYIATPNPAEKQSTESPLMSPAETGSTESITDSIFSNGNKVGKNISTNVENAEVHRRKDQQYMASNDKDEERISGTRGHQMKYENTTKGSKDVNKGKETKGLQTEMNYDHEENQKQQNVKAGKDNQKALLNENEKNRDSTVRRESPKEQNKKEIRKGNGNEDNMPKTIAIQRSEKNSPSTNHESNTLQNKKPPFKKREKITHPSTQKGDENTSGRKIPGEMHKKATRNPNIPMDDNMKLLRRHNDILNEPYETFNNTESQEVSNQKSPHLAGEKKMDYVKAKNKTNTKDAAIHTTKKGSEKVQKNEEDDKCVSNIMSSNKGERTTSKITSSPHDKKSKQLDSKEDKRRESPKSSTNSKGDQKKLQTKQADKKSMAPKDQISAKAKYNESTNAPISKLQTELINHSNIAPNQSSSEKGKDNKEDMKRPNSNQAKKAETKDSPTSRKAKVTTEKVEKDLKTPDQTKSKIQKDKKGDKKPKKDVKLEQKRKTATKDPPRSVKNSKDEAKGNTDKVEKDKKAPDQTNPKIEKPKKGDKKKPKKDDKLKQNTATTNDPPKIENDKKGDKKPKKDEKVKQKTASTKDPPKIKKDKKGDKKKPKKDEKVKQKNTSTKDPPKIKKDKKGDEKKPKKDVKFKPKKATTKDQPRSVKNSKDKAEKDKKTPKKKVQTEKKIKQKKPKVVAKKSNIKTVKKATKTKPKAVKPKKNKAVKPKKTKMKKASTKKPKVSKSSKKKSNKGTKKAKRKR